MSGSWPTPSSPSYFRLRAPTRTRPRDARPAAPEDVGASGPRSPRQFHHHTGDASPPVSSLERVVRPTGCSAASTRHSPLVRRTTGASTIMKMTVPVGSGPPANPPRIGIRLRSQRNSSLPCGRRVVRRGTGIVLLLPRRHGGHVRADLDGRSARRLRAGRYRPLLRRT
jgi:hypothetical protein